jgi:hypothetical protein
MSHIDTSTGRTQEPHHRFERLCAQSPSAKLVYRVLDESDRPLATQTLSERTLLVPRTTRYALRRLRETDLVTRTVCADEPRQYRYQAVVVPPDTIAPLAVGRYCFERGSNVNNTRSEPSEYIVSQPQNTH